MDNDRNEQIYTVATRLKKKINAIKITPTNATVVNEVITLLDLILDRQE